MVCYQGNCVRDKCDPNPCQNGGECAFDVSDSGIHCNCLDGFTGIYEVFSLFKHINKKFKNLKD
jgi:hypothetical protein